MSGTDATVDELIRRGVELLSSELGRPLDLSAADEPLASMGVDSVALLALALELEERLGVEVDPTGFSGPLTVRSLVEATRAVAAEGEAGVHSEAGSAAHGEMETPQPVTAQQRSLWTAHLLAPEPSVYNLPVVIPVPARLDPHTTRAAFEYLAERHPALRTSFRRDGDGLRQVAPARPAVELLFEDAGNWPEREVRRRVAALVSEPFDLAKAPLMRAACLLRGEETLLAIVAHHIVCDFHSLRLLVEELDQVYGALAEGRAPRLAPVSDTPAALARRERAAPPEHRARLAEFWRRELSGLPAPLELEPSRPVDEEAPPIHWMDLDPVTRSAVGELAAETGHTVFELLLAVLALVLHRTYSAERLVISVPFSSRHSARDQRVVDYRINPLPLGFDLDPSLPFDRFLERVAETVRQATRHQEMPVESIFEAAATDRSTTGSPPFSVMFNLLRVAPPGTAASPIGRAALAAVLEASLDGNVPSGEFPLEVLALQRPEGTSLVWRRDVRRVGGETVQRLQRAFRQGLEGVLEDRRAAVGSISLLDAGERTAIRTLWKAAERDYPVDRSFADLLHESIARHGEHAAFSWRGGTIDYRTLEQRTGELAERLTGAGAGPETVIGVRLPRGLDYWLTVLAVLRSGAAFVPLSVDDPPERLRDQLERSGAVVVVDSEGISSLSAPGETAAGEPPADAESELAYVLFTSGSSGRPKAAQVERRGLINHLYAKIEDLSLRPGDVLTQTAPIHFDISIWQCAAPLLAGATVRLVDDETLLDPIRLARDLEEGRVTVLQLVPSLLTTLFRAGFDAGSCATLRWMILTGEALPPALARQWLESYPQVPIVNAYGPTECADDVTHHFIETPPAEGTVRVPIGRALANTRIGILDVWGNLLPLGALGEICVEGVGVGRGYRGDPEKTAAAFGRGLVSGETTQRAYRTGDLGRMRADGSIEYHGRLDQQLKVHGQRIEPEEIEAVLRRHEAVTDTAVVLVDERLVAAVQSARGASLDDDALRSHLEKHLPAFMIPSRFVPVDELPTTPNGKLDRAAVLALARAEEGRRREARGTTAPRTPLEHQLFDVWAEVLRRRDFGVHEAFEEVGGDSLSQAIVLASLREKGVRVDGLEGMTRLSIAALARRLEELPSAEPEDHEKGPETGEMPLLPMQRHHLALDHPPGHWHQSLVLRVAEPIVADALRQAMAALVESHAALRLGFHRAADGSWRATVAEPRRDRLVEVAPAPGPGDGAAERRREWASRVGAETDLEAGPLLRARIAESGREIWLACHHLVVDAVSWAVLAGDLCRAYGQAVAGTLPVDLGKGPPRYRPAVARARRASQSGSAEPPGSASALPRDHDGGPNLHGSVERRSFALDREDTGLLLRAELARPETLLLAATAWAVGQRTRSRPVEIDVEVHGRGDRAPAFRTVGCFADFARARVELPADAAPLEVLWGARGLDRHDRLDRVGIGGTADVCVSYFGQIPSRLSFDGLEVRWDSLELSVDAELPRLHALEVDAVCLDGRLEVAVAYSRNLHRPETAGVFLDDVRGFLVDVLDLYRRKTRGPRSRSRGRREPLRKVLVTGATGLVGTHLAESLRTRTDAEVYCLVRAASAEEATSRLAAAREHHLPGVAEAALPANLHASRGDLGRPDLGLDPEARAALGDGLDLVVHSAARVSFWAEDDDLARDNVDGTRRLLALAEETGAAFHHLSTLAVLGNPDPGRPVGEEDLGRGQALATGYERTKLWAELFVRERMARGTRAAIHRIGLVGPAESGRFYPNPDQSVTFRYVRMVATSGFAPDAPQVDLDVMPADRLAEVVAETALAADSDGCTFHFHAPGTLRHGDLVQSLRDAGYRLQTVPVPDLLAALDSGVVGPKGMDATAVLTTLRDFGLLDGNEIRTPRYGSAATAAWLTAISAEPRNDLSWLGRWIAAAIRDGHLPEPGAR